MEPSDNREASTRLMPLKTTLSTERVASPAGLPEAGAGSPEAGAGAVPAVVSWPRRRRISSMALNRSPLVSQNWGEQPEYSQAPTAPVGAGHTHSLSCHRPAAPPLPSPSSPGHTPSSTMRSPSLSEAPCPAQVLFIWATRARLLFSMVSSSSLAAGLQTHTPLS